MKKKYLLTPGPTPVPERVLLKMSEPIIHHRHPEFREILSEVREGLKYLFQTKSEVLLFASSGTGAMEGAVANTLCRGERVLVVRGGKFGERWTEICSAYGLEVDNIDVEWGKAVSVEEVKARLERNNYRAVLIQASETSTGVKHPVKEIAELTADSETLLIVDGITAVGVFPIPFDEWKLDVLVAGSQKALMLPPGLSFACLSEKAWQACQRSDLPKYYFDFQKERKNLENNQTSYTPAISLVVGLAEALEIIKEMGLEQIFQETAKMAQATREAMKSLGLELFAPLSPSEACTAVKVPEGIDGEKLVKLMREKYGFTIAGGQGKVKGKIFRIAHMGYISRYELISCISALEEALLELGYQLELGRGVKKAMELLAD